MKFDTIIIGGGLAGLVAGICLSKHGQRCVIISSGQSALHFSSGSLDLLNVLPDGTEVAHPLKAIGQLQEQAPAHPYVKMGMEVFSRLTGEAERFFEEVGIHMSGSALKNHYRVTPMGTLKPAWDCWISRLSLSRMSAGKWVLKVGFIRLISLLWNICVKILLR